MKKFYNTALALLVLFSFIATSCGNDDEPQTTTPAPLPSGSYIQGKVDGVDFSSSIMGQSTALASRTGTGDRTLITVQGTNLETNTMIISMMGITTTGTYTVDAEDDGTLMAYFGTSENTSYDTSNCAGATGTLNVTFIDDTKVEGTFNFIGKDDENCSRSKIVTEGSFRGIFAN
jgi:hypothetical protein